MKKTCLALGALAAFAVMPMLSLAASTTQEPLPLGWCRYTVYVDDQGNLIEPPPGAMIPALYEERAKPVDVIYHKNGRVQVILAESRRDANSYRVNRTKGTAVTDAVINLTIVDSPGEGFNDATAASPVGGNPGTTRGQLRTNAFLHALEQWEGAIASTVPIEVDASMDPLTCTISSATLGSAGPESVNRNFSGAPVANTWYVVALENAITGSDVTGAVAEIDAAFNSSIDSGCLGGITGWYYGLDGNPTVGTIDFVETVLHEVGHGLGFLTVMDTGSGALLGGFHDSYSRLLFDTETNTAWTAMSDGQRQASAVNPNDVVWTGTGVSNRIASSDITAPLRWNVLRQSPADVHAEPAAARLLGLPLEHGV
jgi:hypothetical protein